MTGPPVLRADLSIIQAVSGRESVIRLGLGKLWVNFFKVVERTNTPLSVIELSLGKLLVNLLQAVKRINTPLIPEHSRFVSCETM